jgi:hypothetical protein
MRISAEASFHFTERRTPLKDLIGKSSTGFQKDVTFSDPIRSQKVCEGRLLWTAKPILKMVPSAPKEGNHEMVSEPVCEYL